MPIPKKRAIAPPQKATSTPKITLEGTDIVVLDGKATVTVHCDLKLSKNYQSGGASCGFTFVTAAEDAERSAKAAFARVKDIVSQQMSKISDAVEDMA